MKEWRFLIMMEKTVSLHWYLSMLAAVLVISLIGIQMVVAEPPVVNPLTSQTERREDAVPGYVELSDGSIHAGQIYLTRDKRLKISDDKLQRQREVSLSAVKQIECKIEKEWLEKEWKFKELTQDEKMYTGRSYPTREYVHTIRLNDGRTISGGLSAIVYVQPTEDNTTKSATSSGDRKAEQFLLNKRNKGEIGEDLPSLVYVKSIKLGKEAFEEGKQKAVENENKVKKK
jgi:hypothetical protein